ncbi:hypothetical protein M3Y99_00054500 [Aphelenchoides fujianensis]|nr:hypothetical protein M3Y99_00054500 [Aphelenchoides fujianensis]
MPPMPPGFGPPQPPGFGPPQAQQPPQFGGPPPQQMQPGFGPPSHQFPPQQPPNFQQQPPQGPPQHPPSSAPQQPGMPPMSSAFGPPQPPSQAGFGGPPSGPPMPPGMAPAPPQQHLQSPPQQQPQQQPNFPQMPPGGPPMMPGMPQGMQQPPQPGMPPQMGGPPMGPGGFAPPGFPPQGQPGGFPGQPQMQPGFGPPMGGPPMGGPPMPPGMQRAPQQRLDPAMMPSFVQVVEDDRSLHAGTVFNTGFMTADPPPLITTDFVANDQGNSNPKFIRSSLSRSRSSITPFAELNPREFPPPVIDLGEMGPVRCQRCKAYISPFMEFLDGGRKFRCPFCQTNTTIEDVYFAHLDHNGRRTDIQNRPELYLGSYELVGTKHYCKNNVPPKEPAFVFLLDVSYNSVRSGLLDVFCNNLVDILRDLPRYGVQRAQVGDQNRAGHLRPDDPLLRPLDSGEKPKMCIESDVSEVFVPFIEGFFVDFETAEASLTRCLADIRATFADTRVTETILGPAIAVGLDALKAANRNGKIFVFHTNLPTTILTEGTEFYKKLGVECVKAGVCTDVFLFPNAHVDVASIAPVSRLSGGSVYKYQYFDAQKDGKRFLQDLHRDISRPIGFDVMLRVRTSTGLRPVGYYGSFYMQDVVAVEMGALDCDKSIQVEIKYDDKLNESERAFIQVATLFTSVGGQRRLRIHNLALAVTTDHNALYRAADQNAVFVHMLKHAEFTLREKSPKDMKEEIVSTCAHILSNYREKCSENSPIGQLILPEGLKLLPLIGNCIAKCEALSGGSEITVDDRAWMMSLIPSLRVDEAMRLLYPTILPLTGLQLESPEQQIDFPAPVRASMEFLQQNEAYLIENGLLCFIWVGAGVPAEWLQDVFDARGLDRLDTESGVVPERDNARSRAVRQVLDRLNRGRSRQLKTHVVKPNDALESWMKKFLVEDRYAQNLPSYVDFLCDVHREIRSLLT